MRFSSLLSCALVLGTTALSVAAPTALVAQTTPPPPVVFVHGNGDHAGLWDGTIWRFESVGYPRPRLHAIDLPAPSASASVSTSEPNRSTPAEQMAALRAFVDSVRAASGGAKVVLIGSSRGGLTIRNYVRFGGGANAVSHVITCGTPNHGVMALASMPLENEFNGAGTFLRTLNADREVVEGVRFLALRSDSLDKYAQADGAALGMPGASTGVDARGPELAGATNEVLPGTDHREVAFGEAAFVAQYRFITGREPARRAIVPEARPRLEGLVSSNRNGAPSNVGTAGAVVTVHEVDATSGRRVGTAVHRSVTAANGRWGPFIGAPSAFYEFEVAAPDSSVILHVYRSPLPRSSRVVNFRLPAPPASRADSVSVLLVRPRGYFGLGRDTVLIDGTSATGIPRGVPTVDRVLRWFPADSARSVRTAFNGERLVVRTQPADRRRLVSAEFQRD
jgi:triacylglycerol lipase